MQTPIESIMPAISSSEPTLAAGFLASTQRYPNKPALFVDNYEYSYIELYSHAKNISETISAQNQSKAEYPLVAVLAYRSITTYAGLLAVLLSGKGYVPLNPNYPAQRNAKIIKTAGMKILIVDDRGYTQLDEILPLVLAPLIIIAPDQTDCSKIQTQFPSHTFISSGNLVSSKNGIITPKVLSDDIAYLIFTSGSTGKPKGVPVTHKNIMHFVNCLRERYGFDETDRFSQMPDITFDLSVFDIWPCWHSGACLCCVPETHLIGPEKFIKNQQLTVWISVPSAIECMNRLGQLKENNFSTIRWSLFCGEPLPQKNVEKWSVAASNSKIENLYGPTEVTGAFTWYWWESDKSLKESSDGIVPIGEPFPGMKVAIVDEQFKPVREGEIGEIVVSGPQVTSGYWNDPHQTEERYIELDWVNEPANRWYRTGDLAKIVYRKVLVHKGRVDNQIKVRGFRVELGEIEKILRDETNTTQVAVIGWPKLSSGFGGVIAFLSDPKCNQNYILGKCKEKLPPYMVPKEIHFLKEMPLNVNGKIDRKKLLEIRNKNEKK